MADRDAMLRELAQHRGFRLVKSRRRKPGVGDYGRYGLSDAKTGKQCFGFGAKGLEATSQEIEAYLRGRAKADWKSSLSAPAPKAASRKKTAAAGERQARPPRPAPSRRREPSSPKARRAAAPPEKPAAQPVEHVLRIRAATARDAKVIAALVARMDGAASREAVARTVRALIRRGDAPLVAEEAGIVGCAAGQAVVAPQHAEPIGRITLLFTAERERRRGIGTALLKAVEERLLRQGCRTIELVHSIELSNANSFLRRHDYLRHGYRFARRHSGRRSK
jgi:GNAT superfamily N-acetyltransferase